MSFYAKQGQYQNRRHKTEVCPERSQRVEGTGGSRISEKSTLKLRFSVPTNFFYYCRESSTNRPIFMQNKANFKNNQIDVKLIITRDYEKIMHWTLGENKPKQSQSRIGKQKTEDGGQRTEDG